jgi:cardiolipin synthase
MTRARRAFWSWWPWAILFVVVVALDRWWWALVSGLMAAITHLIAMAAPPPRFGLDHEFGIRSAEFLDSVEGATGTPFVRGNTLTLLHNGDAFYPEMLRAIREAQVSITIEAYIYWEGEIGRQFAAALAERSRAGITVHILLDAIGSSSIGDDILRILEDGHCRVEWYNPIRWYTLARFNNRTHRKSLIVDGRIAFTGGAGIADHWRGNARSPEEWRDDQVRLEGPAVRALQTGFAQNWQKTTCELLTGPEFYPPLSSAGTLAVQTLLSSPTTGGSSVQTMYYLSIVCARKSILIANPYFVPDPVALDTLIDARQRGVDVRVMVSGRHNDNWLARQNTVRLFGRLLEAGVTMLDYDRTMMHHKVMVVDDSWVTVGTTNFDYRSFAHNEESNLSFLDSELAARVVQAFLRDEAECTVVTFEAWKRRGIWSRAQETMASLLEEQV